MRTHSAALGLMVCLVLASTAHAEIRSLRITLFLPCDEETAAAAAERLRAVPGVSSVDLQPNALEMTIHTASDYTGDPLALVQLLWESKIYPNKIFIEARGRVLERDGRPEFIAERTGQRFWLRRHPGAPRSTTTGELASVDAEVLDWIEDRTLPAGGRYSLRILSSGQEDTGQAPH